MYDTCDQMMKNVVYINIIPADCNIWLFVHYWYNEHIVSFATAQIWLLCITDDVNIYVIKWWL